jgi:hypothetical protein
MSLTKDFTNSPLHRFRVPNSRNYQNITAPNNILHVSNVPADVSLEELKRTFQMCATIVDVKFIP